MKRKLLSLIAVLAGVGVTFAQPTFNSTDEAAVGTNLNYYLGDTLNFDLKESTNGANATWDWSTWPLNTTINQRTADVQDATADPVYSPLGATQNFNIQDYLNQYSNYDATVKHSQGFRYTTAGTELAIIQFDSAQYNMMEYPFDHTDIINNTYTGSTTIDFNSTPFNANSTNGVGFIEYDGYGTLMLYDTTFTNVARIHQRDSVHASFGFPINDVDFVVDKYEFYDLANLNIPIFICSRVKVYTTGMLPSFDPVVSVYSAVPFAPANLSIEENDINNAISVFPNPATNNLTVQFDASNSSDDEIRLVDLSGKTVKVIANGFSNGINTLNVDVSNMTKGIYLLEFTMDSKAVSKKVVIQ